MTGRAYEQLTAERIVQIFEADLTARGIAVKTHAPPLSDQAWLDCVHSTYYAPILLTE